MQTTDVIQAEPRKRRLQKHIAILSQRDSGSLERSTSLARRRLRPLHEAKEFSLAHDRTTFAITLLMLDEHSEQIFAMTDGSRSERANLGDYAPFDQRYLAHRR